MVTDQVAASRDVWPYGICATLVVAIEDDRRQAVYARTLVYTTVYGLDTHHVSEGNLDPLSTVRCLINSFSPINHCPDDILSLIFQYSVALIDDDAGDFQWPFASLRPSNKLIDLTNICRRWRILALDLPLLWTHIGDRFSDPLLLAAPTFLQRSRSAPLKFHIRGLSRRRINTKSDPFNLHLSRVEELHMDHFPDLFTLHHSAPTLKVLTLDSVRQPNEQRLFDATVPQLKALTMHSMTWFPQTPLPGLTHLCVYQRKQSRISPPLSLSCTPYVFHVRHMYSSVVIIADAGESTYHVGHISGQTDQIHDVPLEFRPSAALAELLPRLGVAFLNSHSASRGVLLNIESLGFLSFLRKNLTSTGQLRRTKRSGNR
ncbi:hypothetical protein BKA93DRAFT_754446 [Sparassis latifolia]